MRMPYNEKMAEIIFQLLLNCAASEKSILCFCDKIGEFWKTVTLTFQKLKKLIWKIKIIYR